MKELIEKLRNGLDLNSSDIGYAVTLLFSDEVDDAAKAEFLTALHQKGESADEIFGFTELLLQRAIDPQIDEAEARGPLIDVCGTGEAGLTMLNVPRPTRSIFPAV